jgi:hypothetical protein
MVLSFSASVVSGWSRYWRASGDVARVAVAWRGGEVALSVQPKIVVDGQRG